MSIRFLTGKKSGYCLKGFLQIASFFSMMLASFLHADEGLSNAVHISAEALYWYTSETVDWAFTLKSDQNTVKTSYKTFSFDWAPGFRVGLGYNGECDEWDVRANYTWFRSRAKDSTDGPVTSAFFGARLSELEPFSSGKASLNLDYNMLDGDLGRVFFVSECLSFRFAIGVKGGWITQRIHSSWVNPSFLGFIPVFAKENLKQTFGCVGPKGGVIGQWYFGTIQNHSFSLIGQLESGYLWGHWSIKDKYVNNFETVIRVITDERNFGSLFLRSFLGVGWDVTFNQDCAHFALKFGYEIEDWFNQCQIFTDTSGSQNNDLILQGLNLSLSFDF